jgi:hypothetical protein
LALENSCTIVICDTVSILLSAGQIPGGNTNRAAKRCLR